jgi:hypothetical protein
MSKVINIFATRMDLLELLGDVEAAQPVHYVEAGLLDKPTPAEYGSACEIPGLGTTHAPDTNVGERYLLAYTSIPFTVRPVPQKRGGTRYAVDQQKNPDSVALIPGGQVDERTILAGSIGTCTGSEASAAILRTIASSIHRRWSEIKSYAVGPEAAIVLDAGGRLTANLRSPREYDLQR